MMKLILIHGQGRTPLSMSLLGWRLSRQGYEIQYFGYFTFLETFEEIKQRFVGTVRTEVGPAPFAIISHSLGGLIARAALPKLADNPPRHLVMLASPNRSPRMAKPALHNPLYRWFTQDCGRKLADEAFFERLPLPNVPTTIIAGTRGLPAKLSPFGDELNDGVLAVEETELAGCEVIVAPALHPFIMNAKDVARIITEVVSQE